MLNAHGLKFLHFHISKTFFFTLGTDHGAQRVAQAHCLALIHGHCPLLRSADADAATVDRNPDPSVAHDPTPTPSLRNQTGGRSGASGGGQHKHML